jgi:hypothetical protein
MTRTDLTVFLSGAAVALTTGVVLGGAMQPHLNGDDGRPEGPQMFAAYDGRSTGPFDPGDPSLVLAAYHGTPPDYVMGTDWKKAMTPPVEKAAVTEVHEAPDDSPPPVLARAAYDEPPPTHDYPSLDGARPPATDAPTPADGSDIAPAPDR